MHDGIRRALLLACVTTLAGCSPPADGYSGARGAVVGRLAIDGQPVPAGYQVMFMATRGRGFVASGTVEQDGRYKLLYRVAQGLPVGDYVVQLGVPSDFGSSIAGQHSGDVAAMTKAWNAAMAFPEKYLSASTSGLTFAVQPGANTADFELTKATRREPGAPGP